MEEQSKNIGAPIPGMSLTSELGSRPWQQPPTYSKVDDAIEYYIDRLSSDEASAQIVEVLETGVPVTKLANIIQLSSVMEGLHTIDVGMLVSPAIIEFIRLIGDSNNVDYRSGLDDVDEVTKKRLTAKAIKEFKNELKEKDNMSEQDMVEPMMEEISQEPMPETSDNEPSGLMARRTA
tara:strand:+ start:422 stop:955 length:534 start_codon:yes stop_codon:yes gene_type:complete